MNNYNPRRGDVKITLESGELVLRPTFTAIAGLEEHFGRSIFDIARDFAAGKCARSGDLLILLKAGLQGAGQSPPEGLEELMLSHGLAKFLEPLGQFLAHACGIE